MHERLQQALDFRNLKQYQLAKMVSASQGAVSQWLSGERTPHPGLIKLICIELDISYEWLTTGKGSMCVDHQTATDRLVQQFDFTALVGKLLDTYQQLPPEHQLAVLSYAQKVIVSIVAPTAGSQPDDPPAS